MLDGVFHLGDATVRLAGTEPSLWVLTAPSAGFEEARQRLDWLDDLAAVSTRMARVTAGRWLMEWDQRHRRGGGPGWTPVAASGRLYRLLALGPWVAAGDAALRTRLGRMAARDAAFLVRRYRAVPDDLARAEAVGALVLAALLLEGGRNGLASAQAALDPLCRDLVDAGGALTCRTPEALADLFVLLAGLADRLIAARQRPGPEHAAALARLGPVLRALRHADGGLARFHGGGGGDLARIDAALAGRALGRAPRGRLVMGFARLCQGGTTVICDAAAPPAGPGRHAAPLAFELTSGRHPVIVNCGAGTGFGPDWRRVARAAPAHSTLVLGDEMRPGAMAGQDQAPEPIDMRVDLTGAASLGAAHDGYAARFGLHHHRRLSLTSLGDGLNGTDRLVAETEADRRRFHDLTQSGWRGVDFALRFHLHPAVEADLPEPGGPVRLRLPNGDLWHFACQGPCTIRLDPSVYLENTQPAPRPCQQIVLTGRAVQFVTQVTWTLAKTDATPDARRVAPMAVPAET